jgi:hypothetical protein
LHRSHPLLLKKKAKDNGSKRFSILNSLIRILPIGGVFLAIDRGKDKSNHTIENSAVMLILPVSPGLCLLPAHILHIRGVAVRRPPRLSEQSPLLLGKGDQ